MTDTRARQHERTTERQGDLSDGATKISSELLVFELSRSVSTWSTVETRCSRLGDHARQHERTTERWGEKTKARNHERTTARGHEEARRRLRLWPGKT
jgi:hypothetical protein